MTSFTTKRYYPLFYFIILFLGRNVLFYYGIDAKVFDATLMSISVLFILSTGISKLSRPLFFLLVIVSLFSLYKLFYDRGEGTRAAIMTILGPILMYAAFFHLIRTRIKVKRKLFSITLLFYIVDVILAIIERILGLTIFGWAGGTISLNQSGVTEFRSTALLGHPLSNALIVSTLMSFFLISPIKAKYKYLLWCIGIISILCFNTRSSIVGNILIFITYLLHSLFVSRKIKLRQKKTMLVMSIIIITTFFILLSSGLVGGRLLEMGLFDDSSAQVRVDIWQIFDYIPTDALFGTGLTFNQVEIIMHRANLIATENYWIDWILRFGLTFVIIYVLMISITLRQAIQKYSIINAGIVCGTFILISSTNNSLSSCMIPLFTFMMCLNIFNEKTIRDVLPKKLLEV